MEDWYPVICFLWYKKLNAPPVHDYTQVHMKEGNLVPAIETACAELIRVYTYRLRAEGVCTARITPFSKQFLQIVRSMAADLHEMSFDPGSINWVDVAFSLVDSNLPLALELSCAIACRAAMMQCRRRPNLA
jgi:hypothetical protein